MMRKTILIIIGLFCLATTVVWHRPNPEVVQIPSPPVKSEINEKATQKPLEQTVQYQYEIPRTLRYSFTLKNTGHRLLKEAEFWAPAPVKQTATQKVMEIETSHPHEKLTDTLGNQVLHFVLSTIPPYASKQVSVTIELRVAKKLNPIPAQPQWFMDDEPFIEVSHPKIQATAKRLETKEKLLTTRTIFNWVATHIQYAGYLRENRGALYALVNKRGDCTEYMSLFTALTRANGIPTRAIGGYVYSDDAILRPEDYHNWAEFYLDNKWQIADPQNKVFREKQSNYIVMRIISNQSKLAISPRFWSSNQDLKVKMN
ncbi:MAG: transglutaminase domain-containing protein [Candidatus Parabeggiatoa sp.]|nr:transglutaminase domain-containing protein [Candidatus Parabeggiatoa sp.]